MDKDKVEKFIDSIIPKHGNNKVVLSDREIEELIQNSDRMMTEQVKFQRALYEKYPKSSR